MSDLPYEEFPRACVIVYNDKFKEVWSYGDYPRLINRTAHVDGKEIDELKLHDVGRDSIKDNLLVQFAFENKPG